MKYLLLALASIPLCVQAQNKAVLISAMPVVLVQDTCVAPKTPPGPNVFAITCGSDMLLLKRSAVINEKTDTHWEKRPASDLRLFTEGKDYVVIQQRPEK